MSSSSSTQKLHPIIPAADLDDGWSLESERPTGSADPNADTRRLQSMPRLATPIVEDAGDFPLARELPKPALGSPLASAGKPSASAGKPLVSAGKPSPSTGKPGPSAGKPSANARSNKKASVGSDISTGERKILSAADTMPLSGPGKSVPSYWSEARLPRPMGELAEGTAPEHEAPAEMRRSAATPAGEAAAAKPAGERAAAGSAGERGAAGSAGERAAAGSAESIPAPWAAANQEIKSETHENAAGFDDIDRAFFAEGEAIANTKQSVDEFVDLANDTLTFWQRLWKR